MQFQVVINDDFIEKVNTLIVPAVEYKVLQDIRIETDKRQVVPFLTGTLDDSIHSEQAIRKGVLGTELHASAPYAIRRYYEPAKFTTQYHASATDHWWAFVLPGGDSYSWVLNSAQKYFNEEVEHLIL